VVLAAHDAARLAEVVENAGRACPPAPVPWVDGASDSAKGRLAVKAAVRIGPPVMTWHSSVTVVPTPLSTNRDPLGASQATSEIGRLAAIAREQHLARIAARDALRQRRHLEIAPHARRMGSEHRHRWA
jgi:hypothetical protein